jgi:hypothetical protein
MTKKHFTVGYQMLHDYKTGEAPCIRLAGQWLKAYGINTGDKLVLVPGKNMIVLMKVKESD